MASKRPARRDFLKGGAALAGGLTLGAVAPAVGQGPVASPVSSPPMIKDNKDQIAYGERSKHVTSVRIPHGERPSPDTFGLTFHVASPLQDSVGVITPSSLHYYATTRGSFLPDIDPRQHTLMIHGLVDRPLTFTMEDLKRFPSVTRLHFIECAGNRRRPGKDRSGIARDDQLRRMDRRAPLHAAQGVRRERLGDLVRRRRHGGSEGRVEHADREGHGRLSPGLRHERRAVRPQNGFPLRLMVPGFEGIFHTKWLRRIKLVDRYYMNYNDYGHLDQDHETRRWATRSAPSRSSRSPPAASSCPAAASTRSAAWPGPVAAPFARWRSRPTAARTGRTPRSRERRSAWRSRGSAFRGTGTAPRPSSCRAARTNSARFNRRRAQVATHFNMPLDPCSASRGWTTPLCRGGSRAMGACTNGLQRLGLCRFVVLMGSHRAGAGAQVRHGPHAERRRNPCLGHLHQSDR